MDLHAPHGPIHSWKDFLLQLGTITPGVLIALSLEGVRDWRHDQGLVREARETIRRELADDKMEVDREESDLLIAERIGRRLSEVSRKVLE